MFVVRKNCLLQLRKISLLLPHYVYPVVQPKSFSMSLFLLLSSIVIDPHFRHVMVKTILSNALVESGIPVIVVIKPSFYLTEAQTDFRSSFPRSRTELFWTVKVHGKRFWSNTCLYCPISKTIAFSFAIFKERRKTERRWNGFVSWTLQCDSLSRRSICWGGKWNQTLRSAKIKGNNILVDFLLSALRLDGGETLKS